MQKCEHKNARSIGRSLDVEWCPNCGGYRTEAGYEWSKWKFPKTLLKKVSEYLASEPWDDLIITDGPFGCGPLFYLKFRHDNFTYESEEYMCKENESYAQAARRVCKEMGWDKKKP